MSDIRLSFCIPTLNRGAFIGETLECIVSQLTPEMEVVIVDGGSTDQTADIVARFARDNPRIRYVRRDVASAAPSNEGFDRDLDHAVRIARGEHCWLFTDDDLIIPGGVAEVMAQLADGDPALLIVDAEVRDLAMRCVLDPRRLKFEGRRDYGPEQRDELLADSGNVLTFVGAAIIRRSAWLARDTERCIGTSLNHVGVIFNGPSWEKARVLGRSLILIRMGNALWTARAFDIWMFIWPSLIWGLDGYSDEARAEVTAREPWRTPLELFVYRAYGSFDRAKRRQWLDGRASGRAARAARVALALPGPVVHAGISAYLALGGSAKGSMMYNLMVASRHSNPVSRAVARLAGAKA